MTVSNRVWVPGSIITRLSGEALERLTALCTYANPDFGRWTNVRNTRFAPPKTIETWRKERGGARSYPRGRLVEVMQLLCGELGFIEWVDETESGERVEFGEWAGPELRPYQERLVERGIGLQGGIWRSRPGSGKTLSVIAMVHRMAIKALVIAPTRSIVDQWLRDSRGFLGVVPGQAGDGKFDIDRQIVIATQKTALNRISEIKVAGFGVVVADETQQFALNSFGKLVDELPARVRLGVSGDERRADAKHFAIYDYFGSHVETVADEDIEPYQNEPEIRIIPTDFRADWWLTLTPSQKYECKARLTEETLRNDERNAIITGIVANTTRAGEQVMCLVERVEHCERLEALIAPICTVARISADDKRRFEIEKRRFAEGQARAAVGTFMAVGVGFESHRSLSRGIIASPAVYGSKSRMQFKQYAARVARDAANAKIVWYLLDQRVFGLDPARQINRWFKRVDVEVGGALITAKEWIRDEEKKRREGRVPDLFD